MRRIGPLKVLLVLLATAGCHRQPTPAPQASPEAAPAATTVAATPSEVVRTSKGQLAPKTEIDDLAGGAKLTIASLKGKPVLLNLWATWCVPCVRELPTLDALAKAQQGKLVVLAVSEDMDGAKVVKPFLAAHKIGALTPYHDNDNGLMLALKEASLPTTILYGADGREIWRVPGDLDWSGAKAKALLAEAGI